ncbi:MAG: hypothetical protein OXE99_09865, partial [Cellvibrionales bacterium]|nr:hypothetical protein [Cellvibrionales bacterium]
MKPLFFSIICCFLLSCSKNKKSEIELGIVALGYTNTPSFLASFPGKLQSIEWIDKKNEGTDVMVGKPMDFAYRYEASLGLISVPAGEYHAVKLKFSFHESVPWFFSSGDYNTQSPTNWFNPSLLNHSGELLSSLNHTVDVVVRFNQPMVIKKNALSLLALKPLMDKSLLPVESQEQPAWIFSPMIEVFAIESMVWPMVIESVSPESVRLRYGNFTFSVPTPSWQLNSMSAEGLPDAKSLEGESVLANVKLNDQGELFIPTINIVSKRVYLGQVIPHPEGAALMGHELTDTGLAFVQSLVLPFDSATDNEVVNQEYFVPGQQIELYQNTEDGSVQKSVFHPSEIIGRLSQDEDDWRINPITINGINATSFYLDDFAFDNAEGNYSPGDLVKAMGQFYSEAGGVHLDILESEFLASTSLNASTNVQMHMAFSEEQMINLGKALNNIGDKGLQLANLGRGVSLYLSIDKTQVVVDANVTAIKQIEHANFWVSAHVDDVVTHHQVSGVKDLYAYLSTLSPELAVFQMNMIGQVKGDYFLTESVVLRLRNHQYEGLVETDSPLYLEESTENPYYKHPLILAGAGVVAATAGSLLALGLIIAIKKKFDENAEKKNPPGVNPPKSTPPSSTAGRPPKPSHIKPIGIKNNSLPTIKEEDGFEYTARDENGRSGLTKKVLLDNTGYYWEDKTGASWEVIPVSDESANHHVFNQEFTRLLQVAQPDGQIFDLTDEEKILFDTSNNKAFIRPFNPRLESLDGKPEDFWLDANKLKPGERGKLVSAAIYNIMFNKPHENVLKMFKYDPDAKELVAKPEFNDTFRSELNKNIEPKEQNFWEGSKGVKARDISVNIDEFIFFGKDNLKFSQEEIKEGVKRFADIQEKALADKLMETGSYTVEEISTIIERFQNKRRELLIQKFPEKISKKEYFMHLNKKYLDDWISKYHYFTPYERAIAAKHKQGVFQLFKEQNHVDAAYADFIEENRIHALTSFFQLPKSVKNYVEDKMYDWVEEGKISIH